ncbi:PEP-CTERM sorting domain-containing protein [Massilia putida]|uniref:PEP-CTERM sorting domain-containing protein n=1 Tax=Massilia putida TaxID=1141883 RepID=UPI0009517280|nr:PEP-CTERM sorting domain-containing protein [Massilia putida]
MKKPIKLAVAAACVLGIGQVGAATILDSGTTAYYGADNKGPADVIGGSTYDISQAAIARAGNVLTITITTAFAGNAGMNASWGKDPLTGATGKGIGYGDVFLSDTWNAAGDATNHYATDSATTGTVWDYGFSLNNRWNNGGGTFKLYALNGATNAQNILNSDSYISCGISCNYRENQETAVNTKSATVKDTGLAGTWSVTVNKTVPAQSYLTFKIDLSGSELLDYSSFAMHWGETCQNDVIEGLAKGVHVPLPGTAALLFLGLGALGVARRRRGHPSLPSAA